MSKIRKKVIDYNPGFYDKENKFIQYERSWVCQSDANISHNSPRVAINCKHCFPELDKIEYEAEQRLKWFIDNYFIHCLDELFSRTSTEDICRIYNVKIQYFRPWIK